MQRMRLLDLTLDRPEENVALDEALLEQAESGECKAETLRFWEPRQSFVVIGRASKVNLEVDVAECERRAVPVLRRPSGGAAIVTGPGCLMYALVLDCRQRPQLHSIVSAHRLVMETMAEALRSVVPGVRFDGTSDLAWRDRKFSGNSLRLKRDWALYHGTLLYDFSLETISQLLKIAPRQPEYRRGRMHREFVTNLPSTADAVRRAVAAAWNANHVTLDWPRDKVERLVRERYSRDSWNRRM